MITASQDLREQITNLSIEEFDPRGQYGNVVRAVQSASGTEEVRVYRVDEGTRVEYYILGLEGEEDGGKIVGVKARAVET